MNEWMNIMILHFVWNVFEWNFILKKLIILGFLWFYLTYLLDNCLANSVYFKNFDCDVSIGGDDDDDVDVVDFAAATAAAATFAISASISCALLLCVDDDDDDVRDDFRLDSLVDFVVVVVDDDDGDEVFIEFFPVVKLAVTNGKFELLANTKSNNSSSDIDDISVDESRIDKCILAKCNLYSLRDDIGVEQNAHFICK